MRRLLVATAVAAALLVTTVPAHASPPVSAVPHRPAPEARHLWRALTFTSVVTSEGTTLTTVARDHVYGWNHLVGSTSWAGRPASLDFLGSVNYRRGSGPFGGFVTVTRRDGTQIGFSVTGWAIAPSDSDGPARTRFRGTVNVIGGTGQYRGAHGTGTMEGHRKASLGGAVTLTFRLTVSIPTPSS